MKVLITTIGFQDPIHLKTVDYKQSQREQIETLNAILYRVSGTKAKKAWPPGVLEGPILTAIRGMAAAASDGVPDEEAPYCIPWTPDEIWVIHQPDRLDDSSEGPMSVRVKMLGGAINFLWPKVSLRKFDQEASILDYYACWAHIQSQILPVLLAPAPPEVEVRVLIGVGTNAARLALYNLGLSLPRDMAQIWYTVDTKMTSPHDPAVRPLIFGEEHAPAFIPLGEHQRKIEELSRVVEELKRNTRKSALASADVTSAPIGADDFRRDRAQSLMERILADPKAPVWHPATGALQKTELREELAKRLAAAGDPVSAETLRRWFTEGNKPASERSGLYLVLVGKPTRPIR